jgi:hypothetical protein
VPSPKTEETAAVAKLKARIVKTLQESGPMCGPELAKRLEVPEIAVGTPVWDLIDGGQIELTWESQLAVVGSRGK